MLIAIDVGNTNVVLGLFEGRQLVQTWRLGTHLEHTSDECSAIVRSLFDLAHIDPAVVRDAIISCVVPPLLPIYERMCTKTFGCQPLAVGPGLRSGMAIKVDNPPEVGADRIVNAVAAHDRLGGPVIAIDFGTAITFDCVSQDGEFVGGAILPGLQVSLNALIERASRLSSVELVRPPNVLGRNTAHMLQSGMLFGHAGMIDSMVERLRAELGGQAPVIATGGLAHLIAEESKTIDRVEPYLTLEGLRLIYERNRKEDT